MINGEDYSKEKDILEAVSANSRYHKVKSKSVTASGFDMVMEVKTDKDSELIQTLNRIDGVMSISLLEHDGELRE